MEASERTAAVFFVGNRLMLDDGVGPAAYDEILAGYDIPENVTLVDVGCMSLDMLPYVERCDLILTVDAVDGTGDAPGTVYRFEPDAMARHFGPEASLHDLKLVDLFDAASLMGYEAEGFCLGMPFLAIDFLAVGVFQACGLGKNAFLFAILRKVVLPISWPTISVLFVFFFVWTWNEYMIPMAFLMSDDVQTIPLALATLQGQRTMEATTLASASLLSIIPTIIFFIIFQRKLSQGITAGAVK